MRMIDWLRRLFGQTTARPGIHGSAPFPPGAGPAQILLLRHAEKTGKKSDPHLSRAGAVRAGRLVAYLPETFGRPDFLFAARTSHRSRRPVETLEPLASALGLPIDEQFDDEDVDALVRALASDPNYQGSRIVVSWRHSDLPSLAAALGAPEALPDGWASDDYTSIVDISFPGDGSVRARRVTMPF